MIYTLFRRGFLFLALVLLSALCQGGHEAYEFTVVPLWEPLETPSLTSDPLIHVGTLCIKKKTRDKAYLDGVHLIWHGKPLSGLQASLYRQPLGKRFLAIEHYWLCDGQWIPDKQTLVFKFRQLEHLELFNYFCMVFTLPTQRAEQIREGYFVLQPKSITIPESIRASLTLKPPFHSQTTKIPLSYEQ